MKTLAGIDFAHSREIDQANPMGWRPLYRGAWPDLAADWAQEISTLADGMLIRFADGACHKRPVGLRSDREIILTNAASADMVSHEEHRRRVPVVRGLALSTELIWFTGIPARPELFELAADRLEQMMLRTVALDVSGRNMSESAGRFVKILRDRGLAVLCEPLAIGDLTSPPWFAGEPTVSMAGVLEAAVRQGRAIPPGSWAWHNGTHPPTEENLAEWERQGCGVVLARGLLKTAGEVEG